MKKLIIFCSVAGCGRSRHADKLGFEHNKQGKPCRLITTDVTGKYRDIKEFIEICQRQDNENYLCIFDAPNLTILSMAAMVEIAKAFDWKIEIITFLLPPTMNVEEACEKLAKRSVTRYSEVVEHYHKLMDERFLPKAWGSIQKRVIEISF